MSEHRNGDLTSVTVRQAIDDGAAFDIWGGAIRPVVIEHRAYVYKGRYYRLSILFDSEGGNVDVNPMMHSWPKPPHWFDVEALRLKLYADELQAVTS